MKDKTHAAAGHAAQHPEAPEIPAELRARLLDQPVGVEVARPGNDRLDRPAEIALGGLAYGLHIARLQMAQYPVQSSDGLLASRPLLFRAQQILLRHHLQNRPHILGHAAVNQHQAGLQSLPGLLADLIPPEEVMAGQQPAAADAEFRITLRAQHPLNQLHPRPDAA